MNRILAFVAAIIALVILNFAANVVAQKIHPTLVSDGYGRRFSYRFVFMLSFLGIIGVIMLFLFILDAAGFRF